MSLNEMGVAISFPLFKYIHKNLFPYKADKKRSVLTMVLNTLNPF